MRRVVSQRTAVCRLCTVTQCSYSHHENKKIHVSKCIESDKNSNGPNLPQCHGNSAAREIVGRKI